MTGKLRKVMISTPRGSVKYVREEQTVTIKGSSLICSSKEELNMA